MPHPAPQRDRTTIAMIMRGNRSATDNIWPEAARGHLARGRISGQRPCDRPRTVSSKARGPTKESKQRQGPSLSLIVRLLWVYWILQLILLRVTDWFFLDPCWLRPLQAPKDHLHEEPFFPYGVLVKGSVIDVWVPAFTHAPPSVVQARATNLPPFFPPRRVSVCVPPRSNNEIASDFLATRCAGARLSWLYLHSCRNLGDLF